MLGARGAGACLVVLLATAAGTGWLYLLRDIHVLAFGPRLADALQLQRLARQSDQPVARLIAAWLPAGLVAGAPLRLLGFRRPIARAATAFVVGLVVLLAVGAVADAVTASDPLRRHLAEQPGHAATWLAAGLIGLGAVLVPTGRWRLRHTA